MAMVQIEIDIDAGGNVTVRPNPATAGNGDTVRWHINSNATNGGSITIKLPRGATSPFGNADHDAAAGVEQPQQCNLIEPSINPLNWPPGVDSYNYEVNFTNSPMRTFQFTLRKADVAVLPIDVTRLAVVLLQVLGQGGLLAMAPPRPVTEEGTVQAINEDDCVNFVFTLETNPGPPPVRVRITFKKAGHESWVETVKYARRNPGTRISVRYQNVNGENVALDIHEV